MSTTDDFTKLLAQDLGIRDSAWLHSFVATWAHFEGGSAENNPLNTTLDVPGATNYNSVGVKNYPDLTTGAAATARTLQQANFAPILQFMTNQNSQPNGFYWNAQHTLPQYWHAFIDAMNTWGSTNFAESLNGAPETYSEAFAGGNVKPLTIADIATGIVTAPIRAGQQAIDSISSWTEGIRKLAQWLLTPQHWFRLFFVLGGLAIAGIGLFVYVKEKPPTFGASRTLSSAAEAVA